MSATNIQFGSIELPGRVQADLKKSISTVLFVALCATSAFNTSHASTYIKDLDGITVHGGYILGDTINVYPDDRGWDDWWGNDNSNYDDDYSDNGEWGGSGGGPNIQEPNTTPVQGKDADAKKGCKKGNPIIIATGNKIEPETDFVTNGEMPLGIEKTYNHYWEGAGIFGRKWVSNFDYKLTFGTTALNACFPRPGGGACGLGANTIIYAWRPSGSTIKYTKNADGFFYEDKPGPLSKIQVNADGRMTLWNEQGGYEMYSSAGYIEKVQNNSNVAWVFSYANGTYPSRVTHTSGRYIDFVWTGSQLTSVRDPAGNYYGYAYTANALGAGEHRLAATSKPGAVVTAVAYHYELAGDPGALTGKSIDGSRYSTFAYDANGYAISSEHSGQDKYVFAYTPGANGLLTVVETSPLGKQATYQFENGKSKTVTGHPSANCPGTMNALTEYDANGYPVMTSDFKGNQTYFSYNAQGQLLAMIEGHGSPSQRTTTYEWWGPGYNNQILSMSIAGVSRIEYHYGATGRVSRISATNLSANGVVNQARNTWFQYEYHASTVPAGPTPPGTGGNQPPQVLGMLASMRVDGPLSGAGDEVTSTYDAQGNLLSTANSLGHAVSYSGHNGLGQPGRVTGANGEFVDYTYDAQGRTVKVRAYHGGVARDTDYSFGADGLLGKVSMPDGSFIRYVYDAARRLVKQYTKEAVGTYAYQTTEYNAMSLPVEVAHSRASYPHDTRIVGNIDGVYDDGGGGYVITGWACSTGVDSSIAVHMYLGGAYGSGSGGIAYSANLSSEQAVANVCQASGAAYRFSIPVDSAMRQSYGGRSIYIHGISPAGRDNSLITGSGSFSIPPLPGTIDNAQFVSQSVPATMYAGESYNVSVTMKNVGDTTWAAGTGSYALGSQNAENNTRWGMSRVGLPHAAGPGQNVTFSFMVTAPATAGDKNFQWRMINQTATWFGSQSTNVAVNVRQEPGCGQHACAINPPASQSKSGWMDAAVARAIPVHRGQSLESQPTSEILAPESITAGVNETITYRSYVDYDELGRVMARRGNGGQNIRYTYDVNDNVRTITDSKGGVTTLGYDALDRLVYEIAPANQGTIWYEYDHGDRVTKVTDRRGLGTTYVYDGFGQLWSQNSPDTGTTQLTYNAEGQLILTTRNDGSGLNYAYDSLGRLILTANNVERRSYSYDWCSYGKGRLCAFETANTTQVLTLTHYAYEPYGKPSVRRDLDNTVGSDDWTGYSYDGMGRVAGMSYPSGVSVGYGYAQGRLTVMQATFNGTTHNVATGMQYQPFGALTNMVYGSGQAKERQYDLDGRMTVTHDAGHVGHTLTYNPADEITAVQNWSRPEYNESFAYDALSRLSSITAPTGNQSFSYDPNGNRTQVVWPGTSNYTVDPWSNRISEDIAYAYDGRGNRSSQNWGGSTATFAYDAFNRLRTASRDAAVGYGSPGTRAFKNYPAGTTTYTVNAQDQRVAKSGPAGTTRFIYGGQTQLLTEGTTNVGWTSYLWMGGEPIAMVRNNQLYYFNNDHLGRPEVVTNQAQQLVWHAANFAFDRSVTYDAIGGLNLGFPGQYYDAETGFWHNGYRDYDSRTGRYLQSDPIGLAGGINTYTYAGANPVNFVDPSGLKHHPTCETKAILDIAKSAATSGSARERTQNMLNNHSDLGKNAIGALDTKTQSSYREPNTYTYGGRTMNDAQFGNYIAGYAGYYYGGTTGLALTMWGGVYYDMRDNESFFRFDLDSRNDIADGARRARNEIENGLSTCGCGP